MKANTVITINGRLYDAITGLPMQADAQDEAVVQHPLEAKTTPETPARHVAPASAHQVHQQPQKSTTLHRKALKRPASKPMAADILPAKPQVQQRSPVITKFAPIKHEAKQQVANPHPIRQAPPERTTEPDAPARPHPMVERAMVKHYAPLKQQAEVAVVSSSQHKEQLIARSLAAATPNTEQPKHTKKKSLFARQPRLVSVLTASLAILVLGGYLTYFNLPNISMRVAATRAGIAANFPTYKPDGYQFSGPITYAPGEVAVSFQSNTGNAAYSVKQKVSTWDSQAVLQNYVLKQSRIYLTYQEHGLTIYSFGNSAAWVNGGVLYTIEGNAPLSSEQLLNIAGSL